MPVDRAWSCFDTSNLRDRYFSLIVVNRGLDLGLMRDQSRLLTYSSQFNSYYVCKSNTIASCSFVQLIVCAKRHAVDLGAITTSLLSNVFCRR
jgi:hypothetical protein